VDDAVDLVFMLAFVVWLGAGYLLAERENRRLRLQNRRLSTKLECAYRGLRHERAASDAYERAVLQQLREADAAGAGEDA
jgi:hypothetical protein